MGLEATWKISTTRSLREGKTLVVQGVASVKLLGGEATAFGCPLPSNRLVLIRPGRALPVFAEDGAELELRTDEGAAVEEYDGNSIPENWRKIADELVENHKSVMVVGGVDAGKTSFCCFLANYALAKGREVQFFDVDPGQANIGPPTMVSSTLIDKPFYDLFKLSAEDAQPVGYTTPSRVPGRCLDSVSSLISNAAIRHPDAFSVIDSDGWIEGEKAEVYKRRLLERCRVDVAVFVGCLPSPLIQRQLTFLDAPFHIVERPPTVLRRDQSERRRLREMGYRKYLKEAKLRAIPKAWTSIAHLYGSDEASAEERFSTLQLMLQSLREPRVPGSAPLPEYRDLGLLSYLYDADQTFLGIGLTEAVNAKDIKIYTSIESMTAKIVVGRMLLSRDGKEIYTFGSTGLD